MSVFITKGVTVGVPPGGLVLTMDDDGKIAASVTLHINLDVWPYWLPIGMHHVEAAEHAHADLVAAHASADDVKKGQALEAEFTSSMQAVMAGAVALDSFYAAVKGCIKLPDNIKTAWKKNRTARPKQVAETLRLAFKMGPKSAANLREVVREVYRFRDLAVHPPSELQEPVFHPVLQVGTEWRFVFFTFENARQLVGLTTSLIAQLVRVPSSKFKDLVEWCRSADTMVVDHLQRWEAKYGALFPRNPAQTKDAAPTM